MPNKIFIFELKQFAFEAYELQPFPIPQPFVLGMERRRTRRLTTGNNIDRTKLNNKHFYGLGVETQEKEHWQLKLFCKKEHPQPCKIGMFGNEWGRTNKTRNHYSVHSSEASSKRKCQFAECRLPHTQLARGRLETHRCTHSAFFIIIHTHTFTKCYFLF